MSPHSKFLTFLPSRDQIFFLPPTRSNLDNPLKLCTFAIDIKFFMDKNIKPRDLFKLFFDNPIPDPSCTSCEI